MGHLIEQIIKAHPKGGNGDISSGSIARQIVQEGNRAKRDTAQSKQKGVPAINGFVPLGENIPPSFEKADVHYGLYPGSLSLQYATPLQLRLLPRLVKRFKPNKRFRAPKGVHVDEGTILGMYLVVAESEKILRKHWERLGLLSPRAKKRLRFNRAEVLWPVDGGSFGIVLKPNKKPNNEYAGFVADLLYDEEGLSGGAATGRIKNRM